ncbi:hypothetical protein DFS34DRAFT_647488 [Phlyctochytrium arcticum]|nr:hypothetical protein DFS34DRAFT_647488 [Phlyctochytrium arcticum]
MATITKIHTETVETVTFRLSLDSNVTATHSRKNKKGDNKQHLTEQVWDEHSEHSHNASCKDEPLHPSELEPSPPEQRKNPSEEIQSPINRKPRESQDPIDIIQRLAELDLRSGENAFSYWLARKRKGTASVNSSRSVAPSRTTLESTKSETSAIHRDQDRSRRKYKEWLRKKHIEDQERAQREIAAAAEAAADREVLERRKKERTDAEVARWHREKLLQKEREEAEEALRSQKEMQDLELQQSTAHVAYMKWLKDLARRKKESSNQRASSPSSWDTSLDRPPLHPCAWVDIIPRPSPSDDEIPHEFKIERPQTSPNQLLSPPHLFHEYSMYKKQVPNFVRKYPLQVASAGYEIAKDDKEQSRRQKLLVEKRPMRVFEQPRRAFR